MKAIWKFIGGLTLAIISFVAYIRLLTILAELSDKRFCLLLLIPIVLMGIGLVPVIDYLEKRSKKTS